MPVPVEVIDTTSPAQTRIGYCGCTIQDIRAQQCNVCLNCKTHCECVQCRACGNQYTSAEMCSACHFCREGCCNCFQCFNCDRTLNFSRDQIGSCERCGDCTQCCHCFICSTCSANFSTSPEDMHEDCGRCQVHCLCYPCRVCNIGMNIETRCRSCSGCPTHCACQACPVCGLRFVETRRHHRNDQFGLTGEQACGNCLTCCRCNVKGVAFRNGAFVMFNSVFSKGEFKKNPLKRHISVEMEVDKFDTYAFSGDINKTLDKWKDPVVRDGSINGFEINTNPANGDVFLKHIKEICDGLEIIKAGCSTACGLHVHINVKGNALLKTDGTPMLDPDGNALVDPRSAYTHYDLRRLTLLYHRTEQALFGLCHPSRLTNRYCIVCGKYYLEKNTQPKDFRKKITEKLYAEEGGLILNPEVRIGRDGNKIKPNYKAIGDNLKSMKREKYRSIRYKALNLHSFFLRGTVEFRHHEGTVDFNKIIGWALTCGTLVDMASKLGEKQISELPTDSREALLAILPDNLKAYAKQTWEKNDNTTPRFKQLIEETWARQERD